MSTYEMRITVEAMDEITALPHPTATAIVDKLTDLRADPYALASTAVTDDPAVRRLRVDGQRVYYRVSPDQVTVVLVRPGHGSL